MRHVSLTCHWQSMWTLIITEKHACRQKCHEHSENEMASINVPGVNPEIVLNVDDAPALLSVRPIVKVCLKFLKASLPAIEINSEIDMPDCNVVAITNLKQGLAWRANKY